MALENNCECSVAQPLNFVEGTEPRIAEQKDAYQIMNSNDAISAMFYQTLFDTSAWGKLYHRSLFETGIRYPKGLLFEDNPTTYLLLAHCQKVAVSQRQLYFYLLRKDSIQGQDFNAVKLDQGLQILSLMQEHPEVVENINAAYRCKMASLAFHFIMKMPLDYKRSDELLSYVKKYRWSVVWDGNARMKTRIGCALSYFGIPVMKKIFTLVNERNR